jgi:hypothetical protein
VQAILRFISEGSGVERPDRRAYRRQAVHKGNCAGKKQPRAGKEYL